MQLDKEIKKTLGKIISTALAADQADDNKRMRAACHALETVEQEKSGSTLGKAAAIVRSILAPIQEKGLSMLDLDEKQKQSITSMIQRATRAAKGSGIEISESEASYFQQKSIQATKLEEDILQNFSDRYSLQEGGQDSMEAIYDSADQLLRMILQVVGASAAVTSGVGLACTALFKVAEKAHEVHLDKTAESLQARSESESAELLSHLKQVYSNALKSVAERQKARISTDADLAANNSQRVVDLELAHTEKAINEATTHQELISAYDTSVELLENFHQKPGPSRDIDEHRLKRLQIIKITLKKEIDETISQIIEIKKNSDEFEELCKKLKIPFATAEWIRDEQQIIHRAQETGVESKHDQKTAQMVARAEHYRKSRPIKSTAISDDDWHTLLHCATQSDMSRLRMLKKTAQELVAKKGAIETSIQAIKSQLPQQRPDKDSKHAPQEDSQRLKEQVHRKAQLHSMSAAPLPKEEEKLSLAQKLKITRSDASKIAFLQKRLVFEQKRAHGLRIAKRAAKKQARENSKLPAAIHRLLEQKQLQAKEAKTPYAQLKHKQTEAEHHVAEIKDQLQTYRRKYVQYLHQGVLWERMLDDIAHEKEKITPFVKKETSEQASSISRSDAPKDKKTNTDDAPGETTKPNENAEEMVFQKNPLSLEKPVKNIEAGSVDQGPSPLESSSSFFCVRTYHGKKEIKPDEPQNTSSQSTSEEAEPNKENPKVEKP